MEATEGLMAQHRVAEQIMEEILRAKAPEAQERLARDLAEKLLLHMELEERVFYPAVLEVDSEQVGEAYGEHQEVKTRLEEFLVMKAQDPEFIPKLRRIQALVAHHVEEEEQELFPKCREHLGADGLEELGEEMEAWIESAGQYEDKDLQADDDAPTTSAP